MISSASTTRLARAAVETLEERRLLASIAATTPFHGQQQVAVGNNITVRFGEPMTASTISASTLQIRDAAGNLLASQVSYDATTRTATINPSTNLAATNAYYTVRVLGGAGGVKDSLNGTLTGGTYDFSFTTGTPQFTEQTAFSNLINPTAIQFAPDGRVFVAEKRGVIKVYDSLTDATPTVFADLRAQVHNYSDRGLLGLALDPQFSNGRPYVYALYTFDGDIGGSYPKYGTASSDSDPGNTTGTSLVSGRLTRLTANGNQMTGSELVLVHDWAQQFSSHSIGDLKFGPDGYLYASAGDGASYNSTDTGQFNNPFGDPNREGGALRSQDIRTTGDATGLDGSVIRIDPNTGLAAPGNPYGGSSDANAQRIIAYGLRNPFRITFRPGSSELWIADTGWNAWEEINRITNVADTAAENFGWPAYEGPNRQAAYDGLNVPLLESLYTQGGDTKPWFAYSHSAKVVPNSSEPTGGSTPTGLAFYTGDAYAAGYTGALFFADYARKQIYVMYRGVDGLPDQSTRQIFKATTNGAVQLMQGPDGNIYYADLNGGRIQRFAYTNPTPPPPPPTTNEGKLSGTIIGTAGSYASNGFTREKAFDGDVYTFFDAPTGSGAWAGLDFGSAKVVKQIRFAPRFDWAARLVGGRFEASNDANFASGVVTLHTVSSTPAAGTLTSVNVNAAGAAYRYVRFYSADGAAVNIAEMEFHDAGNTSTANGDGLRATYFNNTDFSGSSTSRIDEAVHFFWGEADSPATGISPLTYSARWTGQVQATAAGTYTFRLTGDDGIRLWVGGVLLIDQWKDQAPTSYTASATFTADEKKDIRVEYYQNAYGGSVRLEWKRPGQTAYEVVPTQQLFSSGGPAIGTAPVPTISQPGTSLKWAVGQTISFSGSAFDAEEGTLAGSALQWTLVLMHANEIDPSNVHEHIISTFAGASGSFAAPDHEYPSWLELRLKATDASGQSTTITRRIDPQTIKLTLSANIPGATMVFNDLFVEAPTTRTWIAGATATISAPAQVVVDGKTWNFTGWTQGGTRTQTLSVPAVDTTYTAMYAEDAGGTTVGRLTGAIIGTSGSYQSNGYTRDKVFDGNVYTFFDAPTPDGAWVGLDLGAPTVVRQIRFAPRFDWPSRLVGGRFEGSNTADFSSGVVTLHAVTVEPAPGVLTSVSVNAAGASFRYIRFFGADDAAVNIAEMELYDTPIGA